MGIFNTLLEICAEAGKAYFYGQSEPSEGQEALMMSSLLESSNSILQSVEQDDVSSILAKFSLTEILAHSRTGAYGAFRRNGQTTVEIPDGPNLGSQGYNIIPIKTQKAGLVAEIFVPVDKTQSQIYMNWTGTHNLATVIADLETAPGEESYRSQEMTVLAQINQAVKQVHEASGKKVNITVTGHSLGGALAQLNVHSLQRAISANVYDQALNRSDSATCKQWIDAESKFRRGQQSNLDQPGKDIPDSAKTHLSGEYLESITLGTWNAAGVLKTVTQSSHDLSPLMKKSGVKQHAYFGMVGGDAVQMTGQDNLFSHADRDVVDMHLLKMDKGYETGLSRTFELGNIKDFSIQGLLSALPGVVLNGLYLGYLTGKAHTSKHFNETQSPIKYELFDNQTDKGKNEIHKKLTNKSSVLQWAPLRAAQRGLYYLANRMSDGRSKPDAHSSNLPKAISAK